ncbi:MAG TPA: helix-turn-helix transcriptional regulator [Chitinophagaceae bacterium]|nr:helix-turn-helix transcriptional regulator [Chitinophagaceae bacterium]
MDIDNISISGEQLQKLRIIKGLKQVAMAELLDISQQAYSKIERSCRIEGTRLRRLLKLIEYTDEDIEKAMNMIASN